MEGMEGMEEKEGDEKEGDGLLRADREEGLIWVLSA